uniref:Uncharacterized protein n=1 Tax=Anguilla anguilla TaxID=7936 RepID=A0A0E9R0F1_ANGAN
MPSYQKLHNKILSAKATLTEYVWSLLNSYVVLLELKFLFSHNVTQGRRVSVGGISFS